MSAAWDEAAWRGLAAELAAWDSEGRAASLWWRDDDAGAPHPGFDRLLALAARTAVPLALAVVPARLSPEVTQAISRAPGSVCVLQHGWAHVNHEVASAPGTAKVRPAECGGARPAVVVLAELREGQARLRAAFGPRFLPVFVPPWNRIAAGLVATLPDAGYRALSTFRARDARTPVPGLTQVNCHADPILWRDGGRFAGATATLERLRAHLADRRGARVDPDEPTGLLTHHRDMDEAFWVFLAELLGRLRVTRGAALPPIPELVDWSSDPS